MVLTGLILRQLDGSRTLHTVDNGKLAALGADNGHIRFNLVGMNHGFSPVGPVLKLSEFD